MMFERRSPSEIRMLIIEGITVLMMHLIFGIVFFIAEGGGYQAMHVEMPRAVLISQTDSQIFMKSALIFEWLHDVAEPITDTPEITYLVIRVIFYRAPLLVDRAAYVGYSHKILLVCC